MSNFDFGQLVITKATPSLSERERALRNQLDEMHTPVGYIRVHACKVVSPTAFYAAVSFKDGPVSRAITYVAGTIRCSKKSDGYWLAVECFLATASVPHLLSECPVEVFNAGEATGFPEKVNGDFKAACIQYHKEERNRKALRKGAVFKLDSGAPSVVLQGEQATYAIVLSKSRARFIEPVRGIAKEAGIEDLISNFSPVDEREVPVMPLKSPYKQAGGLFFDRTTSNPVLKGRIAFQSEEKRLAAKHRELKGAVVQPSFLEEFASRFRTACWMS